MSRCQSKTNIDPISFATVTPTPIIANEKPILTQYCFPRKYQCQYNQWLSNIGPMCVCCLGRCINSPDHRSVHKYFGRGTGQSDFLPYYFYREPTLSSPNSIPRKSHMLLAGHQPGTSGSSSTLHYFVLRNVALYNH